MMQAVCGMFGLMEFILNRFADEGKRLYLEFLHMKGIVMHNNKPSLADLVIVDPVWLLETVTAIICRPDLHGDETASHLGEDEFNMLYKQGGLHI